MTSALPDFKATIPGLLLEGAGGGEEARRVRSGCPGLDTFPGPPLVPQLPCSCVKAPPQPRPPPSTPEPPPPGPVLPQMGLWSPPGPCAHPSNRGLPSSTWDTLGHPHLHTDISTHACSHAHAYTLTSAHVPTPTCRCLHRQPTHDHVLSHTHAQVHAHSPTTRAHSCSPIDTNSTHIYTCSELAGMHTRAHTHL